MLEPVTDVPLGPCQLTGASTLHDCPVGTPTRELAVRRKRGVGAAIGRRTEEESEEARGAKAGAQAA
eukprot:15475080-Alexandrium_andersonii.AAC.1